MGPGPPSAHLHPCSGQSLPPRASLRAGLMTQLAAPGHPQLIPHHLQPGSARNSLGLLPSTSGLQPRVLPQPSGPGPGSAEAPRWGLERGQQGEDTNPLPAGCRGRWGNKQGGAILSSAEGPRCPGVFHPCLVSSSASWSPGSMGSLPAPLSSLPCFLRHLCFLVSPNRAFREGGGAGEGTRSRGKG